MYTLCFVEFLARIQTDFCPLGVFSARIQFCEKML